MSLSFKFEQHLTSGCWDILLFIFWGHLPFEVVFHWRSSSFYTFVHSRLFPWAEVSNLSKIRPVVAEIFYFSYFKVIFLLRSSSIWGHLHLIPLYILGCSHELKFQIWARSDQWLLRYSTFNILRSSSIWSRLPLEFIFNRNLCTLRVVPLSLSFKFEQDLTSGCWHILLFIFWGLLPFEVVFHWRSSSFDTFVHSGLFPWA